MYLTCYILYSKSNNYLINKYYKLKLLEKIGEGNYGLIYEISKNYVIKIFKNSLITTNINNESESVIPLNNENREISFFISYLKNKTANTNFIIDVKSIGILVDDYKINNLIIKKNSFFMILPSCISIYKLLNLWKTPLINNKDGIEIVLNIMKRLIDIQLFLYNNYNIINLDIKTDNLMIEKKNKLIIDNIINIDLGLIKTKNNNTYQFDCKYIIWPSSENIKLEKIPSYSICINGLEILLGKEFIEKNKKMNIIDKLYFLKNNDEVYNIFYNGLLLKLNLKQLLVLILNYLKKNKNV
jgi:hypothetical protein